MQDTNYSPGYTEDASIVLGSPGKSDEQLARVRVSLGKDVDISIVIVAFNNHDLLEDCLKSLYTNVPSVLTREIIVVDNNSSDNTVQMLQKQFPGVKIIANTENVGFARANNQALRIAGGRYFLLLNSDTLVLEGLEKIIEFMDTHPEIGAVAPTMLESDGLTVQPQCGGSKRVWQSTVPTAVKSITGAAFLIRRDAYHNVGGLDEHFFFYNEDIDWCKRIRQHGWLIYYYPQAKVIHHGGSSTPQIGTRALVEGWKGGLYFVWKHYRYLSWLHVILLSAVVLLLMFSSPVKMIFAKSRKAVLNELSAYVQILRIMLTGKYRA